jgi:hypothetical protein
MVFENPLHMQAPWLLICRAFPQPMPTDFAGVADFSPSNLGTDFHDDPARTIGSPIALEPSLAVDNQQVSLAHSYGTHLQNNIRQPKIRTDGTVTYSVSQISSSEPSSHITAMTHPLWRQTMHVEFDALLKNKTWHLVPPQLTSILLILNGFSNSRITPTDLLLATKLVWWPRDSSSSMVSIMMLHSVMSSSRPLFACCYLWRSLVVGLFGKLISKMHFCMVFLMKMCT